MTQVAFQAASEASVFVNASRRNTEELAHLRAIRRNLHYEIGQVLRDITERLGWQ